PFCRPGRVVPPLSVYTLTLTTSSNGRASACFQAALRVPSQISMPFWRRRSGVKRLPCALDSTWRRNTAQQQLLRPLNVPFGESVHDVDQGYTPTTPTSKGPACWELYQCG